MERWLSWSKAHDWKSCRAPKALKGSNPFLSAMNRSSWVFTGTFHFAFFAAKIRWEGACTLPPSGNFIYSASALCK